MKFRKLVEIITVYSQNHMKRRNTLCGKYAQVLNAKAGGTYSHHRLLTPYPRCWLEF